MKRVVRVGLISYTDPESLPQFAMEGAEVDVHPEHVESFDRLNVLPGDPPRALREPRKRKS